jgi:phosphatidate cytidylyltransferase
MLAFLYPAVIIAITTFRLFSKRTAERSLADLGPLAFGIIYIPGLLIPQWLLRLEGIEWIFFLYLCVWTSDTTAYYVGKTFGKQKLYPEISPKKTVQGAFGSVAGGCIAAAICGLWFLSSAQMTVLLGMGLVIGGISIVGDLVESMFKRDADIKDSGGLIPGHGGVLDRFDSVLFAGPALYCMQQVLA